MIVESSIFGTTYQTTTKNKSFIVFSNFLKSVNVEFFDEPLILTDGRLLDVDPFSEDIPEHIQTRIIEECKRNPWYFFRECVRYNDPISSNMSTFNLNKGSYAAILSILDTDKHVLYKAPRETRSTINMLTIMLYLNFSGRDMVSINGKTKEHTWLLVTKLVNVLNFPSFMRKEILKCIDDMYNAGESCLTTVFKDGARYDKKQIDSICDLHKIINVKSRIIGTLAYDVPTDREFEKWELGKTKYDSNTIMIFMTMDDLNLGKNWYDEMCRMLNNDKEAIKKELELI